MLFVSDNTSDKWFKNKLNNARLQVVNRDTNKTLSKILELTTKAGFPILINTSLNAKGKPIVNSVEDYKNEMDDNSCNVYDS